MRRAATHAWRRSITATAFAFIFGLPCVADATPIVFRIFNLGETTAYVIQRNTHTVDTEATSEHGVFSERIEAAHGDRIVLSRNDDLAPPVPPVLTSVKTQGPSCARLAWTPSGDPTVVGYLVSWGFFSVEQGQTTEYQFTFEVGAISNYDFCSIGGTRHYFSVQAINSVGQVSAYSNERSVDVTTTATFFSRFDARAAGDMVNLSWDIESDEEIAGYRVYRRGPGPDDRLIVDAPLPASATRFVDTDVRPATTYTYTLTALQSDGTEIRSAPASATTPSLALAIEPNQPNPFRFNTRIPFTLDRAGHVRVRVYDVRGAWVTTLFDGEMTEGSHEVSWGGHDANGTRVASGTYFCTLTAGKFMRSHKMLIVR